MPDTPVGTNSPDYGPLTSADLGATIYCKVTATNASGSANADSNTVGPVTAGAGGWTPADLTGLLAWYKADTGIYSDTGTTPAVNDAEIKQWNDQSGNGRHIIRATPGADIVFKSAGFNTTHPCLLNTYSSAESLETAADTVPQGGTAILSAFVVGRADAGIADSDRLLVYIGNGLDPSDDFSDVGSAILMTYKPTNSIGAYKEGFGAAAPITTGTNYRFGSVFDGTNHTMYLNNVATGTPVGGTEMTHPFTSPGAISLGGVQTWVGAVAEIVVTNTVLSSGDRTSLDDYFKTKWGLT